MQHMKVSRSCFRGNSRFAVGTPEQMVTSDKARRALVSAGQQPHSAILGCADSRVPIDTVFDANPGDIFVLRNAGNTCHPEFRVKDIYI